MHQKINEDGNADDLRDGEGTRPGLPRGEGGRRRAEMLRLGSGGVLLPPAAPGILMERQTCVQFNVHGLNVLSPYTICMHVCV